MYKDKITLDQAMHLESIGDITIIDPSPKSVGPLGDQGIAWKENFVKLQSKHRHISPEKLLTFISAKYSIEIPQGIVDQNTSTYSWRYLHGVQNSNIVQKSTDNIEYVYILVNAGHRGIVKIGMTTTTVNGRVTSLNASSTVDEWVAKFAICVSKGSAYKVEQAVHSFFASQRVSSDMGGSREFFTVDPLTAFDKVREVGALFMVGNPIVY